MAGSLRALVHALLVTGFGLCDDVAHSDVEPMLEKSRSRQEAERD